MNQSDLAQFLMIGQAAKKVVKSIEEVVPSEQLLISKTLDLALMLPKEVRQSIHAATAYKLFFVFESFIRALIKDTLSEDDPQNWWESKVPKNIKDKVAEYGDTDEIKAWMAIGVRERLALTTYPQLFEIINHRWKEEFESIIRDRSLIEAAKHLNHLRNAICHMSDVPEEEMDRLKQTLRDWFRIVTP